VYSELSGYFHCFAVILHAQMFTRLSFFGCLTLAVAVRGALLHTKPHAGENSVFQI